MQYRKFGKDGWKASILGFGAMRLPSRKEGGVDLDESIRLIRAAVDRGVNYIDTAYFYHDGQSETIVGAALRDGYREKVRIATKSPGHLIGSADDFDRILDEQIRRLDVSSIDYYLFHGIGDAGLRQINDLGLFERMENAKKRGLVHHIGFSFHDGPQAFKRIIDNYDAWEMCQIQYNYMDVNNQAGTEGLRYAASRNIPVVVMEPLLGGRLASPPLPVARLFRDFGPQYPPAEWSLRWIWNHPEVSVILSGMNAESQLEENGAAAARAGTGVLGEGDQTLIRRVRDEFIKRTVIPCTRCRYCMPCPSSVDIPRNIEMYNEGVVYGDLSAPRFVYTMFTKPENRAGACSSCRACEEKCPQKIGISEWMPKIQSVLGEGKPYPEDNH
jgi:uncharacterized protein